MMKLPLISRLELFVLALVIGMTYGVAVSYFSGFSRQAQSTNAPLFSQVNGDLNCQQINVAQYTAEE